MVARFADEPEIEGVMLDGNVIRACACSCSKVRVSLVTVPSMLGKKVSVE